MNSRIHRADRRAVASCRQTFKKVRRIRDFQNKIISKACARHNLEYVTLMKKGKRAGLPKRVRSPRVCAQGVGGGHNTHIETAVFFWSGSFFFF